MTQRKRGRTYQVDLTLGGKRIRGSFPTAEAASAYEHEARAAHAVGRPLPKVTRKVAGRPAPGGAMTISGLVDYVDRLHWRRNKTAECALRDCRLFMDFVGHALPASEALTTAQLEAYVASIPDLAGTTVNRRLAPLSVLHRYALQLGLLTRHLHLPRQRATPGRSRWYTHDEVAQIIDAAKRIAPDYALLFMFLIYTGARLGEAERLDWRRVDMPGRRVSFMDTKNGENRGVALAPAAVEALRQLERRYSNRAGPFAFVSRHKLKTVWSQLRAQLDWLDDECVVHTFRHTCASWLTQAGVDQHHIMDWMGHKSPAMTRRYAHLAPRNHEAMAKVLSTDEAYG